MDHLGQAGDRFQQAVIASHLKARQNVIERVFEKLIASLSRFRPKCSRLAGCLVECSAKEVWVVSVDRRMKHRGLIVLLLLGKSLDDLLAKLRLLKHGLLHGIRVLDYCQDWIVGIVILLEIIDVDLAVFESLAIRDRGSSRRRWLLLLLYGSLLVVLWLLPHVWRLADSRPLGDMLIQLVLEGFKLLETAERFEFLFADSVRRSNVSYGLRRPWLFDGDFGGFGIDLLPIRFAIGLLLQFLPAIGFDLRVNQGFNIVRFIASCQVRRDLSGSLVEIASKDRLFPRNIGTFQLGQFIGRELRRVGIVGLSRG